MGLRPRARFARAWCSSTKHSDRILFFWEMENNLRLIKLFQNEQGTFFNKVKQLITASPTLTTYPLLSQLHSICLPIGICWLYSLQLQALLAPGLLATKHCCLNECVYTCWCMDSYFHPLHYEQGSNHCMYLTVLLAWKGRYYSELKTKQVIKIMDKRSRLAGFALPRSWRQLQSWTKVQIHVPSPLPTQYNVDRSKELCLDSFNCVRRVGVGG